MIKIGIDISNYVELRDRKTGTWNIAPIKVEVNTYVPSDPDKPHICDTCVKKYVFAQPWYGRNSELFRILSGDCDNSIIPGHRGLPHDVTDEVREKHEQFRDDEYEDRYFCFHETWYTLAELEAAAANKKRYPKWDKWVSEDGIKYKEPGVGVALREYVDSIRHFANICGYYDSADVRVIMWWDW